MFAYESERAVDAKNALSQAPDSASSPAFAAACEDVPERLAAWFARRPVERELETGRLLQLVAAAASAGWTKRELVASFYPRYGSSSAQAQLSAEVRLDKLLQRARRRLRGTGLALSFCCLRRRWVVQAIGI